MLRGERGSSGWGSARTLHLHTQSTSLSGQMGGSEHSRACIPDTPGRERLANCICRRTGSCKPETGGEAVCRAGRSWLMTQDRGPHLHTQEERQPGCQRVGTQQS